MAEFTRARGVSLAPHAKTTMCPGILRRQVDAGVWGFTVATVRQAQTLRRHLGVERLLVANQVVEPRAIDWLGDELRGDEGLDVIVLADSPSGVARLHDTLRERPPRRPLGVLIELAEDGGRAGCRTDAEALAVANAVVGSPHLELRGVEGFDVLMEPDVAGFLSRLRGLVARFAHDRLFRAGREVIVSAGTSETFEEAAAALTGWELDRPVRTLLRPGGYATYDIAEGYRRPLEIWSPVLSCAVRGRVIAGFGRRDVPSEAARHEPVAAVSSGQLRPLPADVRVERLMDQHAFVAVGELELDLGDLLGFSIGNDFRPAFATWRSVPLVDDDYRVVEMLDVLY
jgi:D-serine deaminase-like pyridoxal phosphate-dependent protein